MSSRKHLIIGCGSAGINAARTIHGIDKGSNIKLISHEFEPFYIKPAILDLVTGELDRSRLIRKKTDLFDEDNIEVLSGKRVVDIYPSENVVAFSDKSTIKYNFLLVATGGIPVSNPMLDFYSGAILYIKKEDWGAEALRAATSTNNCLCYIIYCYFIC